MVAVRPGAKGWPLVQAIYDYVHERITFGYNTQSDQTSLDEPFRAGAGFPRVRALAVRFAVA